MSSAEFAFDRKQKYFARMRGSRISVFLRYVQFFTSKKVVFHPIFTIFGNQLKSATIGLPKFTISIAPSSLRQHGILSYRFSAPVWHCRDFIPLRKKHLFEAYRRPLLYSRDAHSHHTSRQNQKCYPEQQSVNDIRQCAPLIYQCWLRLFVFNS